MGGANLEVFKFGLYMFFPIAVMFKFGDPDWYTNHVIPFRDSLFPPEKSTHVPPKTHSELQEELARMKAERAERIARRQRRGVVEVQDVNPTGLTKSASLLADQSGQQGDDLDRRKAQWMSGGRLV